jgi:hypothetical protein
LSKFCILIGIDIAGLSYRYVYAGNIRVYRETVISYNVQRQIFVAYLAGIRPATLLVLGWLLWLFHFYIQQASRGGTGEG